MPAAVIVTAGAVLAGTMLASAAAPTLPRRTPAQLLAAIRNAPVGRPMTAVISQSANLGIPALPDIGGNTGIPSAFSAVSFLTGTHTIDLWYGGPKQLRVALPVSFGETDLRVNGNQVWLWDSHGQTATHLVLPARQRVRPIEPAGPGAAKSPLSALSPIQAAQLLLARIGPSTRVSVAGTTTVAGRPAYLLAIAPRSHQSLIGRITIALDAKTHLPLQVQVFARGSAAAAFQVGFTSLSFGKPAASNFRFTPPPGAKVRTVPLGRAGFAAMAGPASAGTQVRLRVPRRWAASHWRVSMTKTKAIARPVQVKSGQVKPGQARSFGTGWLAVHAFPVGQIGLGLTRQSPVPAAGQAGPLLGLVLKAMTRVHGSWGTGRLLRTKVVSVLLTSKGELLIGAVTPSVLFADAAKLK